MTSPRVSVICIFHNGERFIREAIDSVLAQDFKDFELLLVDDGSADSSTAIALDYARRFPGKVRYLEHRGHANLGMSAARNLGVVAAAGEYIAFIDSDDVWSPVKLREQVAILDAHAKAAMVCGTVNYWKSWDGGEDRLVPTGKITDRLSIPPSTVLELYPLGYSDAPCPSDVMVRHSTIEAVGGFEDSFPGLYEDVVFFSKIFTLYPVWFASACWVDYRRHSGSSSSAVSLENYRRIRLAFLEWYAGFARARDFDGKDRVLRSVAQARWETIHPLPGRWVARARRAWSRLRG